MDGSLKRFFLQDNLFYFIVGVNHNELGTTVYNSISTYYVTDPDKKTNIYTPLASYMNYEYELFDFTKVVPAGQCTDEQRKNLFVIQVARPQKCISGIAPMCFDNDKLSAAQPFVFFSRANLNPTSATHPDPNEVVFARVLEFRER